MSFISSVFAAGGNYYIFTSPDCLFSAILTWMAETMDLFLFFLFWEYQVKYYITL